MTQQPSKWARPSPTIRVGVLGVLVTFLLVLPLALTPRADAYVYWNSENGIGRANLDGTGVKKGSSSSRMSPTSLSTTGTSTGLA